MDELTSIKRNAPKAFGLSGVLDFFVCLNQSEYVEMVRTTRLIGSVF
jgi:hypothetical protein